MKKIVTFLSALLLIALFAVDSFAANQVVKGKVTDAANGESLPGVAVMVKGTTNGVVTDIDGNYSISAPADAVLLFSSVGYKSSEVAIAGKVIVNVVMSQDNLFLDEVVVTAMGISREKKALGYATQDLNSDELNRAASASLSSAIQGKIAGVEITQSSGMPGASAKITIRGSRSFDGNNTPLYVVDGMPVASVPDINTGNSVTGSDYASRSLDIDPNDIESINVLKGQAASALYGMRASNGVIIITTKKGNSLEKGRARVTFSTNCSVDVLAATPQMQTEFAQGQGGYYTPMTSLAWGPRISDLADDPDYGGNTVNDFTLAEGLHPGKYYVPQLADAGLENAWATPMAYNNVRDFFRPGFTNSNNISVGKNGEKANFMLSLGNTNVKGIVPSTGLNKYNARVAVDTQLGKNFDAGVTANYVMSNLTKQSGANDSDVVAIFCAPPSYNMKGIPTNHPDTPYTQILFRSLTFDNPYWAANNNSFTEKSQRFFGNAFVKYHTDFKSAGKHKLEVKYQLGMDAYSTSYQDIFGYGHGGGSGEISEEMISTNETNSLVTVNYDWNISDNWKLHALVGNEIVYNQTKDLYAYGSQFNFGGWNSLNNTRSYSSKESFLKSLTFGTFANLSVDYKSILFLNATFRSDYVSTMPNGNRTFSYPSVSAGFVFTEIGNLKNNKVLSFGKIRASYAEVGQAGIYRQSFYAVPSFGGGFSTGTPAMYPTHGSIVSYTPYQTLYDPNLRPQNTKSYEAGIDLAFFDGRISLGYTYSRQNVKDQIFAVPMASSTGYVDRVTNAGMLHTDAHEITFEAIPVQTRNFEWTLNMNFAKINNVVDELAEGVESIMLGGFVEPQIRAGIGYQYPVIYGYDYLRNEEGKVVVDEYGIPQAGELAVLGAVSPDFTMGFGTGFRIKKLNINLSFDWKKGGKMYAGTYAMMDYYGVSQYSADVRKMDSFMFDLEPSVKVTGEDAQGNPIYAPNDIQIPGDMAYDYFNVMSEISKYFVHDSSYLKLREVSVSYPIVDKKWGSISLSLFGRNILLWSAIKGFDPEASQGNNNMSGGFERFSLPGTSSYGGGLTFKF